MTTAEHERQAITLRARITRLVNQARQQETLADKLRVLALHRLSRAELADHLITYHACSDA